MTKWVGYLTLLWSFIPLIVQSQNCDAGSCTNSTNKFPSNTFSTTSSTWSTVSTGMNAGNWTLFNVSKGSTYDWTYCSSFGNALQNWNAELTLFNEANGQVLCYQNNSELSNCPNAPYLRWPATFNGTVRLLTSMASCQSNSGSPYSTLVWRRFSSGCEPVSIVTQPKNQSANVGSKATFSVSVNGTDPFLYFWYKGNDQLANGSNSSYTTPTLTSADNGNKYHCIIINCNNLSQAISNTVTLEVNSNCTSPSITSHPVNQTINASQNVSFSVSASGTALNYQWQVSTNAGSSYNNLSNGGVYSNVINKTLDITGASASLTSNRYRCVISNSCGTITSNGAILTVNSSCVSPSITVQPANQSITAGQNTSFSVSASGTSLNYQWQVSTNAGSSYSNLSNGGVFSNVTNSTLNITGASTLLNSNRYRCVISNGCGTVTSNGALLSISTNCTTPSINSQPTSQSITTGQNTSFSISATGTSLSYQWQVSTNAGSCYSNLSNGGVYSNVTNSTLNITGGSTSLSSYRYRCVVSNSCGTSTSNGVILTVNASCTSPAITLQPNNRTVTAGLNTSFNVTASGTSLSYQWQVSTNGGSSYSSLSNTGIYSNVTSISLNITSATLTMNGYLYRCGVSNSCGIVNSNAATLTVNNIVPLTINSLTFTNKIDNHPSIPQLATLYTGSAFTINNPVKICADGSTSTYFKVNVSNTSGIGFRILDEANQPSNNADKYGQIGSVNIFGSNVEVTYSHPKYMDANTLFRVLKLQVTYNGTPINGVNFPLHIYRAPVIMVHGLWGGFSTFAYIDDYLETNAIYPPLLTLRANYGASNDGTFDENRFVLPTHINTILTRARNSKFSASKVDIVAHSMGGLISRYYLQSNDYQRRQDIHKLVTLNTPHSGSQLANLLINPTHPASDAARLAAELLFKGSIYGGAIDDLAVNSLAMEYLNSTTLNKGIVPSHTIITKRPSVSDNFFWLIYAPTGPILGLTGDEVIDYIFYGENNDLVVSFSSQSGGLAPNCTTTINNQGHLDSHDNPTVRNEVIKALKANSNSSYFAQDGFKPTNNQTHFKPAEASIFNRMQGSLSIDYPESDANFSPGMVVPVNITSHNGIDRIILEGINLRDNSDFIDTNLSGGIVNYPIPANAIGKLTFLAIGYDGTNLVDYDTVTININETAELNSISYDTDTLYIQASIAMPVFLKANYSNGNTYDISFNKNLRAQAQDTSVAKIISPGLILGKQPGITYLNSTYSGLTEIIPVVVIPEDTTIKKGTLPPVTPTDSTTTSEPSSSLKIFPNPNSGDFHVYLETMDNEEVQIDVYNSLGQLIFKTNRKTINKRIRAFISLNSVLRNGVHFLRVTTKNKTYGAKVLLLR